jgi:hypothetical protein
MQKNIFILLFQLLSSCTHTLESKWNLLQDTRPIACTQFVERQNSVGVKNLVVVNKTYVVLQSLERDQSERSYVLRHPFDDPNNLTDLGLSSGVRLIGAYLDAQKLLSVFLLHKSGQSLEKLTISPRGNQSESMKLSFTAVEGQALRFDNKDYVLLRSMEEDRSYFFENAEFVQNFSFESVLRSDEKGIRVFDLNESGSLDLYDPVLKRTTSFHLQSVPESWDVIMHKGEPHFVEVRGDSMVGNAKLMYWKLVGEESVSSSTDLFSWHAGKPRFVINHDNELSILLPSWLDAEATLVEFLIPAMNRHARYGVFNQSVQILDARVFLQQKHQDRFRYYACQF